MSSIKQILGTSIVFSFLDMIWLGLIAKDIYFREYGVFLRQSAGKISPLWLPAIVVYILLIVGIFIFVLPKANGSTWMSLVWGSVFGLVTYGVYDFTNLSVINNWSITITLIDVVWGSVLCGITSIVATLLGKQ